MSVATAIGRVGEALRNLLQEEMNLVPAVNVSLLAPDENGPTRRINLFLYKVAENSFLKNKDWEVSRADPGRIVPPPLSLNLFYLLTPYAQNDPDTGNTSAHELLGDAMRVFHEHPLVPAEHLPDELDGAREQIKLSLHQPDMEEITKVWSTFSEPYRLSVIYEVSVVQIDALPDQARAMAPRVRELGVPEVSATMLLPVVEQMSPVSGAIATAITFSGSQLNGRRATVRISGQLIADAEPIEGNSFNVSVPAGLSAGFHTIRVDISSLFRRAFSFEVTP